MSASRRRFLEASAAASALVALGELPRARAGPPGAERWVKGVCRYCGTGCGILVGVDRGRVSLVRGDAEAHNAGELCLKGFTLPQILAAPDRLLHPLVRQEGRLTKTTWAEALDFVARRFREAVEAQGPDAVGFYGSAQATAEEAYAAAKLFRAGIGTNNVDGSARMCSAAAEAGYRASFGLDEPAGCYEDLDQADVFLLIGLNAAETHPVLFERIRRRRQKVPATRLVVVDPRRTPTARAADVHLACLPGSDAAVLNAMAWVLLSEKLVDLPFLRSSVSFGESEPGDRTLEDYASFLLDYAPERVASRAGCRAVDIVAAARAFGAKGRGAVSLWAAGLNQHLRGGFANSLVHNLHLLTGKVGRPGSASFALAGQGGLGGIRAAGALAHTLPCGRLVANADDRAAVERLWGLPSGALPARPGLPGLDLFRGLARGTLRCLYVMGSNPGQSLPALEAFRAALDGAFLVVSDAVHPTRTTELADVVLPAALWCEKEGVLGCTDRRFALSEKAVEPPGEARADLEILCDLARRLGHGALLPFRSAEEAWAELLRLGRGTPHDFSGLSRARLREAHGLQWPLPAEGHPGTKRRYVRGDDPLVPAAHPQPISFYGAPGGRAVVWLRSHEPPRERPGGERPFLLTTGRRAEHWNTGTLTRSCGELRHSHAEAVAEIHPGDARRLRVTDGDVVRVTSSRGSVRYPVRVTDTSREGILFVHVHDPERPPGWLTGETTDPATGQPELKTVPVGVEKT